jgi:hypothetical protein
VSLNLDVSVLLSLAKAAEAAGAETVEFSIATEGGQIHSPLTFELVDAESRAIGNGSIAPSIRKQNQ